jgi:hypothetical protein
MSLRYYGSAISMSATTVQQPTAASPPHRGVLPLAQLAIDTLRTSKFLLFQLPAVRRLALVETLRAAKSDESVRHIIFGNLSTSPYLSEEQKVELSRLAREWSEHTSPLSGGPAQQNDEAIIAGLQAALKCDRHKLDLLANTPPLSAEEAFRQFRFMVVLLFQRSRKLRALPSEIRRDLGRSIHEATSREQLVEIALTGLEGGHAFPTAEGRERVTQDILDERYDLLLLPDRLDCIDRLPRLPVHQSFASLGYALSRELSTRLPAATMVALFDGDGEQGEAAEEVEDECPICLGENLASVELPCKHRLCPVCRERWARQHTGHGSFPCPLCRAPVPIAADFSPRAPAARAVAPTAARTSATPTPTHPLPPLCLALPAAAATLLFWRWWRVSRDGEETLPPVAGAGNSTPTTEADAAAQLPTPLEQYGHALLILWALFLMVGCCLLCCGEYLSTVLAVSCSTGEILFYVTVLGGLLSVAACVWSVWLLWSFVSALPPLSLFIFIVLLLPAGFWNACEEWCWKLDSWYRERFRPRPARVEQASIMI